jgi:hypothetical protein
MIHGRTNLIADTHSFFEEIDRLFYNYRPEQLNRRYYTVLVSLNASSGTERC